MIYLHDSKIRVTTATGRAKSAINFVAGQAIEGLLTCRRSIRSAVYLDAILHTTHEISATFRIHFSLRESAEDWHKSTFSA